jgi:two-component system cell cycle sensor histidine kinase/response regulator CckA
MQTRRTDAGDAAAFMRRFEHHAAMILLINERDGGIVEANPAAVRFYGYSHHALCSLRISDINQRPSRDIKADVTAAFREERNHFIFPHRLASGEIRTVEVYTSPVDLEGTRFLFSIIHDISEQVRAQKALKDSEEKFSRAFHGSPDSININRYKDGVYLEINEGFTRVTGYTTQDVLGRSSLPGDLGIWVNPEDRQRMVAGLAERGEAELEAPFRRKDGSILIGQMSARLIEIDGVKCVLSITRNVTERKRMDEMFLTAEKLESLSLLAGGIAHDFNNLLAGILGNISLARTEIPEKHPAEASLHDAESAVLRARDLTLQLLTFARGGAPVTRLADVGHLVRDAAVFASHGSPCACAFEIHDGLWPAEIDEAQLSQVVQNVVINAVQAMPTGGQITVRMQNLTLAVENPYALPAGPYLSVSIADQGTGIPEGLLKRIFDPYFTTKQSGSGLGLATSYSIIRRHKGYLGASSAPGGGSTFTFLVPAAPEREVPRPVLEKAPLPLRGGKVLVMDDQEMVRVMAVRMLDGLGFVSVGASSGEEALELYATALSDGHPFDVVILDLTVVGGLGGKETLSRLLALDPAARVVVSSGYSNDPVLANHRRFGARGVLAKPYRLQEMKQALLEVMEARPGPG